MFINRPAGKSRWIHSDFLTRVHEFTLRTEERFIEKPISDLKQNNSVRSALPPIALLQQDPYKWIQVAYEEKYPQSCHQLLCSEDVDYFIQLCKEKGKKPVNFIPVIDKELQFWFKKDSLWQCEDLEAVQDQDVGRVVILQGL